MATWNPVANELFLKALELSLPARRQYLDEACAGDAGLRAEVEALLDANAGAGSFLDKPTAIRRPPALTIPRFPTIGRPEKVKVPAR